MFEQLNGTLALRENDTCLEYSENKEALKKLMAEITVSVNVVGKDKYFQDDTEDRIILRVIVLRGGKDISFRFGMSTADTDVFTGTVSQVAARIHRIKTVWDREQHVKGFVTKRKEIKDNLLYSLLSCIASDYSVPETFHDFCGEFGYDEDSRKAEKTFHSCLEQSHKLHSIFTDEEIDCLPR